MYNKYGLKNTEVFASVFQIGNFSVLFSIFVSNIFRVFSNFRPDIQKYAKLRGPYIIPEREISKRPSMIDMISPNVWEARH